MTLMLPDNLRFIMSIVILILTARFQVRLAPYKLHANNDLEVLAMIAGVVTLMSAIAFQDDNPVGYLNIIFLVFIIAVNIKFLLEWVYLFTQWFSTKYSICRKVVRILSTLLFKRNDQVQGIQKPILKEKSRKKRKAVSKKKLPKFGKKRRPKDENASDTLLIKKKNNPINKKSTT